MIDFRYHIVSIVAVFLALAIGIVLGTTALRQPVLEGTDAVTKQLRADNENLRGDVSQLRSRGDGSDTFVEQVTPQVVRNRLDGERIVVVEAPDANDKLRGEVVKVLKDADATITGTVTLTDKYLDDSEAGVVDDLTTQLKPAQLKLPVGSPYERAAVELASAIVTSNTAHAGQEDTAGDTVLSGFKTAGYLTHNGKPGARATLALMIAPEAPFKGKSAAADNDALVALARALDQHSQGTVLVGTEQAVVAGGLIRALRGDDAAAKAVSSVDTADIPAGRVVTVLALAMQADGKTGQYGTGPGVDGFLPTPVPAPPKPSTTSTSEAK